MRHFFAIEIIKLIVCFSECKMKKNKHTHVASHANDDDVDKFKTVDFSRLISPNSALTYRKMKTTECIRYWSIIQWIDLNGNLKAKWMKWKKKRTDCFGNSKWSYEREKMCRFAKKKKKKKKKPKAHGMKMEIFFVENIRSIWFYLFFQLLFSVNWRKWIENKEFKW